MSMHPEPRLNDEQWARIRALLQRIEGKLGLKGGTPADRPNPWHIRRPSKHPFSDHQYHFEPHWAITDPATGRLLTTAETDAFMHRLGGPRCLDGTCRHYLGPSRPEASPD
jgi:hypothetical protein